MTKMAIIEIKIPRSVIPRHIRVQSIVRHGDTPRSGRQGIVEAQCDRV